MQFKQLYGFMRNISNFFANIRPWPVGAVAACLCFAFSNGLQLFDWDELNFAEIAREQFVGGSPLRPRIDYLPFYEKPPLFTTFQWLSYHVFGVNPLAARAPNFLCGLLTVGVLWKFGRSKFKQEVGHWWAAFLAFSLLPALYFQSAIIDPWFNLFILLGLWPSLSAGRMSNKAVVTSGCFLGLAVLTKGPAAGLIAGLCWLVMARRPAGRSLRRLLQYLAIGLLALLPIAIWLAYLWQQGEQDFTREFLLYQWRLFVREDAGHGGFPGYHVVVLLFGCFPASWFALRPLLRRKEWDSPTDRGMRTLFWVVLILFSIVNTKIVHYSSLCYFPVAWFAARAVTAGDEALARYPWSGKALRGTWLLYALLVLGVAGAGVLLPSWLPRVTDAELLSRLSLPVTWPWYAFLPGLLALAGCWWQGYAKSTAAAAAGHLSLTALFLAAGLFTLAPRVQQYTQGAPVAFFSELAGKDVYVGTAYYKSYAHYFYAAIPPGRYDRGCHDRQCRFHGLISKRLYFVSPLRTTEQVLREVPDAELLYQQGGFSFYLRSVVKK